MLEIIHAIAPGAELWFATGNSGASHMADNILTVQDTAHCNIMADDLTYPLESPFQDDDIGLAVNQIFGSGRALFLLRA